MRNQISFTPDAADLVAANRCHFLAAIRRPRTLRRYALLAVIAAVAGAASGWFDGASTGMIALFAAGAMLYAMLVLAGIIGLSLLLLPRRT